MPLEFVVDDSVRLRATRVSQSGGSAKTFAGGSIGRVCKAYASGFYCVQFPGQCLRVREDFLEATDESAPECTDSCYDGC